MARIKFEDLLELYRNTQFAAEGETENEAELTVASQAIADLLARLETDEDAAADAGIALLDDLEQVALGAKVKVRIDSPRLGLGVLARSADGLLNSIGARVKEPKHFYLVAPPYAPGDPVVPDLISRYRKVLELVQLFATAASFLDATRSDLIFVKDDKIVLPILFDADDLEVLDVAAADRLLIQFADELHHDQKCSILFEALVELCRAHRLDGRFKFVLANLTDLADKVAAGYRLFASSFSYSKIKGEFEDARIDYTQKIHKTIVDIQSQLLGIPVATVIVASQMKRPTVCGAELWINFAVLVGAWIFVATLVIAIINQWLTLNVIKDEICQKKKSLQKDFAPISEDFVGTFDKLNARIWWHRAGLALVMVIGLAGAGAATFFNVKIAALPPLPCTTSPLKIDPTPPPPLATTMSPTPAHDVPTTPNAVPTPTPAGASMIKTAWGEPRTYKRQSEDSNGGN